MKTKTVNGTSVEIIGLSGNNMVIVNVAGRSNIAQVDARMLVVPKDGIIPEELKELKFYSGKPAEAVVPSVPLDSEEVKKTDEEKGLV